MTAPAACETIAAQRERRARRNTHTAVDAFYREGLKARGRDNGAPGVRNDYSPSYYAAFLLDPDGNNVEAVCTR